MTELPSPLMAGAAIRARIDALAAISSQPDGLTRVFASPEQRRAAALVAAWMRAAGMTAREDAIGNVVGRYEGAEPGAQEPGAQALLLGSHLDSVRDAGRWDGPLGVVTAIACVDALHRAGARLPVAVEVVGFCDEEGTRFGATMLGSRALTGRLGAALPGATDEAGTTMAQAMRDAGFDPDAIGTAARRPEEIAAYLELHIEQGPVLERAGLPVGCVTAIAGQTRLAVTLAGMAGHAGTVPMAGRQDALAAAAEAVLAVEAAAREVPDAVGTVGRLEALPGAVNVIPGRVRFTVDLRAPADATRAQLVASVRHAIERIAAARGIAVEIGTTHEQTAAPCAPYLQDLIAAAIAAEGHAVRRLPSGAGHDAMEMAAIAPIGMVFVRCRAGISHHPDEHVDDADAEAGARVLHRIITGFAEVPA
ncbi:MAG TPA: allantoate amidohydrolase [Acetobacteraceae bacterium]|nr:allantoate amidohydrolase [Acetobacteraceae bacterium]